MMSLGEVIIRFAESSVADLEEIRLWYTDQGVPDVGESFVADIFQRVEALEKHPELGRIVPEFNQPFLRELIQPPFRVIYRYDPGQIRVVRIWRSERLLRLPKVP